MEVTVNNILIAKETKRIIKDGQYELAGEIVKIPAIDYESVDVISPQLGEELLFENREKEKVVLNNVYIVPEDSFQAAKRYNNPLVMNFANAHKPGGGFEFGATAQEEALCRCSTLIASIGSEKAKEMYQYNNSHIISVESDYMLLSKVCVFRNEKCELVKEPFLAGVITVPAPNRMGLAALTPTKKIDEAMIKRIQIMLLVAKAKKYKSLVLGAWGCGAFRNNPENVAKCFKIVLEEYGYAKYFDNICFAIYGSENGKNITAFRKCFEGIQNSYF